MKQKKKKKKQKVTKQTENFFTNHKAKLTRNGLATRAQDVRAGEGQRLGACALAHAVDFVDGDV